MNKKREGLFAKVRALLAKTVENGCTEAEAMAALELARRLMAEHEITEKHTHRLEQDINALPETWLWSHKRWKHKRPVTA